VSRALDGWNSTHGRDEAGTIVSKQSVRATRPVVDVSEEGARLLGRIYWLEIARTSHGLVRSRESAHGVDLRLLGRGPLLLRFGREEVSVRDDGVSCRYRIQGGLLARRAGGALSLSQTGSELHLAVSGFHPRLGVRPYELVQQRVHVAISRRYLARLIAGAGR
jgi:hypothetical protein